MKKAKRKQLTFTTGYNTTLIQTRRKAWIHDPIDRHCHLDGTPHCSILPLTCADAVKQSRLPKIQECKNWSNLDRDEQRTAVINLAYLNIILWQGYYKQVWDHKQTEPTRWTCKSRQINEERRRGGSWFGFFLDHQSATSLTRLRFRHWSVCRSQERGRRVHSVYCSKSPFPRSGNNTYGTIATLTTSHIRSCGRLHSLIRNDWNSSAV